MSRKQKKKDAREQSTRQLMGIDDITDYGIATRMGELVFFAIKPTNISVLPDAGVGARIYALLNVVKGMAEIEMLALNSKESFENNKAWLLVCTDRPPTAENGAGSAGAADVVIGGALHEHGSL